MTKLHIPYLVAIRNRSGRSWRFYWQPSKGLRAAGWAQRRLGGKAVFLSNEPSAAVIAECRRITAAVEAWREAGGSCAAPGGGRPDGTTGLGSAPPAPSLADLVARYLACARFAALAPESRRNYLWSLEQLPADMLAMPLPSIMPAKVGELYERLALESTAKAARVIRVLHIVLQHGRRLDLIPFNPASKLGVRAAAPRLRVASDAEVEELWIAADQFGHSSVGTAVLIAADTGQRQGDILAMLRLQWQDRNKRLMVRQSKRRANISVRLTPGLDARLYVNEARNRLWFPSAPTLLVCESTGGKWEASHFGKVFARVRAAAAEAAPMRCPDLANLWFADLRDTALTNLARAGATILEICAVSGHTEASATTILKHYVALDEELADSAIAKLVEARKSR